MNTKFEAFNVPGKGWNVRAKDQYGQYVYLTMGGPYTMQQAQIAADACRRDASRHGAEHVLGGMLIAH